MVEYEWLWIAIVGLAVCCFALGAMLVFLLWKVGNLIDRTHELERTLFNPFEFERLLDEHINEIERQKHEWRTHHRIPDVPAIIRNAVNGEDQDPFDELRKLIGRV